MTVLVFDSGIGGLSVMREARLVLHDHRFVYVGDDAGFPYGDWQESALTQRMVGMFETLVETYQPQLAIVACNTASTLIMPALRSRFDIPFVGIVPAIKPAAERTASGLITVLATPGTVARRYTSELIEKFASHCEVKLVGATGLARLAEDHMQFKQIDDGLLQAEIAPCFVERDGKRTDIITLGCTHYPFLVNEMRKLAPWPVDWLDPAQAVAQQARRVLNEVKEPATSSPVLGSGSDVAIMSSGAPPGSVVRLLASMGMTLNHLSFPSLL
ncbi:MAG: glutamate racemase [Granulosicoccus sp.]